MASREHATRRDDRANSANSNDDTAKNETRTDSSDGSSFARVLLGASVPNNSSRVRRRPSLFDQVGRQENGDADDDEPSNFSMASLTQDSTSAAAWQLRRRKSIDNNSSNNNNNKRSRSSLANNNNNSMSSSHVSGTQSMAASASSSSQQSSSTTATSRSLFTTTTTAAALSTTSTHHSVSTIVCNTQDVSRFARDNNNNSNGNHSLTPKASGRGQPVALGGGRTSLFGSVMQQAGQRSSSSKNQQKACTPSKQQRPATEASMTITTPLHTSSRTKKRSAFTPDRASSSLLPFGSPGGFQLLDFVNNFGSPFSHNNNKNNSNLSSTNHGHNGNSNSNLSTKSSAEEWQNTSITTQGGVMDWSLPESLRLDCHPGVLVNSILLGNQHHSSGLGMMQFLQPPDHHDNNNSTAATINNEGVAEWGAGLLFWQHPAVYPSPFKDQKAKKETKQHKNGKSGKSGVGGGSIYDDLSRVQPPQHNAKKKRRASLDLASAVPAPEAGSLANKNSSLQQQKARFKRQRRVEWQQAFASLYWKWISQVKGLLLSKDNHMPLHKAYFYARADDHVVLFQAVQDADGGVHPKIIVSSSSAAFRDKLRHSGVENLRLLGTWNGHPRAAVFTEEMIRQEQGKVQSSKDKPLKDVNINTAGVKTQGRDKEPSNLSNQASSASTLMESPVKRGPGKDNATSKLLSPTTGSNSPMVEAELAALRRAQVFGETVGADVTISIKPNKAAAGPKLSLIAVPPLFLTGFDDCAAFFEVYLNLGSSCCVPYKTGVDKEGAGDSKHNDKKTKQLKSNLTKATNWKLPGDVPLLLCRGVGPFIHATMKSLTVNGDPQYALPKENKDVAASPQENQDYASLEIQGGPILPCAILDCFRGLVKIMVADHNLNPPSNRELLSEEDAMVGSHNLILHAFQPRSSGGDTEEGRSKVGIVGSSCPQTLNHCSVDQGRGEEKMGPDDIRSGNVLGMAVWDVLHPRAMAYKADPIPSSSSLLFPP